MQEKKRKLKELMTDKKLQLINNAFRTLEYLLNSTKKPFKFIEFNVGFTTEFMDILRSFLKFTKQHDLIYKLLSSVILYQQANPANSNIDNPNQN